MQHPLAASAGRLSMWSRSSLRARMARLINIWFGALAGLALILCAIMGLWAETMSTLALVVTATVLALVVGIPIGIVAGFRRHLTVSSSLSST